jgi:hypothetical protein
LREKGTPYAELGLGDTSLSDEALVDAMMAHPILINRPLVVSPLGVKLCRPSEAVLDLLPSRQLGAFAKEDGEQVVDAFGERVLSPCRRSPPSPDLPAAQIGTFERYLTLWVALCIVPASAWATFCPACSRASPRPRWRASTSSSRC